MAEAPQRLLDPVEPHIGLREEYIRDEPVTVVLAEKLFQVSGDDFIVSDTAGHDVLRVQAKGMSLRDKKVISSIDHMPLYALSRKFALMHRTVVEDAEGKELFSVQEQWSWKSKLKCTIPTTQGPVTLNIHGRAWKYAADILLDDGKVVATLSREGFTSKEGGIKNKQTYYVTIAPGVDISLIVVLCLAFDDLKRAEGRRYGAS